MAVQVAAEKKGNLYSLSSAESNWNNHSMVSNLTTESNDNGHTVMTTNILSDITNNGYSTVPALPEDNVYNQPYFKR